MSRADLAPPSPLPAPDPPTPDLPSRSSIAQSEPAIPNPPSSDRRARGRPSLHGLRRTVPAIAAADADFFNAFRDATLAALDPQDPNELFLAEQIVAHRFFLLHADDAEAAAMRRMFQHEAHQPINPADDPFNSSPRSDAERLDRALAASATAASVHTILKYRTTHDRALDRAERTLRLYRALRIADNLRRDTASPRLRHRTNHRNSPRPRGRTHPQSTAPPPR